MNKKFLTRMIVVLGMYFILYATATIFKSDFWAGILSPIGAFISFTLILHAYLRTNRKRIYKVWLVFSLAPLCWAIGDLYWFIDNFVLGNNADENIYVLYIYLGVNVFLFAASFLYGLYQFRQWNGFQLAIDSIVVSVSILYLLGALFFNKDLNNLGVLAEDSFLTISSMVLDIAMFVGIAIWYFSIRGGKIPIPIRIISISILLFVITDIGCLYITYLWNYETNTFIDAVYMLSMLGISTGLLNWSYSDKKESYPQTNNFTNIGYRHRTQLIFSAPVMLLILKGFDWVDIAVYAVIVFIHGGLSIYVQAFIKNKQLLIREKLLNVELERRISKRTEELLEKNRQLADLANKDILTNLYNRRYFLELINKKTTDLGENETLALIYIDIDRFKIINDTYGHLIGDKLLLILSNRFLLCKPEDSFLARLGGDEFVVGLCGMYSYTDVEQIALKFSECSSIPIELGNYKFQVTISAGVSIYPLDAMNSEELMRNADIAMYQAKKAGYNKCVSFNERLEQTIRKKNEIELLLKSADIQNEFVLHYQPQYDIKTNKIIGMEALIRWNCAKIGLVYPSHFIPIAEETELIIPIGNWVLESAIKQISKWNSQYGMNLKVGVNVSPKQLDQIDFKQKLLSLIKKYDINPAWLDIEITEDIAIKGKYKMGRISEQFEDAGVSISIDDFGTGYSSLSLLKLNPFERVKIAKELIDNITSDRFDRQIVRSIISLADSIGIKTIAEGVERKEQFELLKTLGCKQIQGYYIGKPVTARVFESTILCKKKKARTQNAERILL